MSGSALIGALRVYLGLDSAAFTEGLTGAQVRLKAFDAKMKSMGGGLAKVGAAVSLVGAGLAVAIRNQINAADELDEMSQRIGVPVEQLSRLKYAAELTGVGVGQLETSLGQLSKKMAEAAKGGKGAKLFADLGISVTDAEGRMRATEDVLGDIADVMSKMPPGAERTALAMKLLGKSGAQMLPMLESGSEGLREMAAEATRMGLVISGDTASAAGRFNENLDKLRGVLGGISMIIAARLAPVLADFTAWLVDLSTAFQGLSPETQTWIAGIAAATVVLGPALIAIGALVSSLGVVVGAIRAVSLALLANPVLAVIAAIAAGAYLIYTNWETLVAGWKLQWAQLSSAASSAWEGIKGVWNGGVAFFTKLGTDMSDAAMAGWSQMADDIKSVWESIKASVGEWVTYFRDLGGRMMTALKDGMIAVIPGLGLDQIGQGVAKSIGGQYGISTGGGVTADPVAGAMQSGAAVGGALADGVTNGYAYGMQRNAPVLRDSSQLPEKILREETDTNSPSRVFELIGRSLMQGLGLGIERGTGAVAKTMAGAGKTVTDSIGDIGAASDGVFERMGRWMADLARGATSLAQTLRQLAGAWSQAIGQSVFTDISGLLTGSLGKVGGGILTGILGGLMGFANGGSFQVGGVGGIDSQIVAFRASPNETVSVSTPGQMVGGGGRLTLTASELTLSDDGRIMAVVRAEMMQSAQAAAAGGAAMARAAFPDIRRRAKERF